MQRTFDFMPVDTLAMNIVLCIMQSRVIMQDFILIVYISRRVSIDVII